MLSTVGDVAAAAKKVWPEAVAVNVGLAPTNSISQKMYRVSALAETSCLLGQLDAASLNKLKALLEQRLKLDAKQCVPTTSADP